MVRATTILMSVLIMIGSYLSTKSVEFLYPVASLDGGSTACVIYQKTSTHIELWQWDVATGKINQVLLSRFTPGGVRLLPNNRSCSFIDNGIIMVKEFIKRSPGSLELSEPLYDISILNWIDSKTCYISGKKRNHYGIFQINRYGDVDPIIWDDVHDYMYPQKIDGNLFCVERTTYKHTSHYRILKMIYPEISINRDLGKLINEDVDSPFDEIDAENDRRRNLVLPESKSLMVNTNVRPVSFLNMVSDTKGYYISHPPQVSASHSLMELEYYQITLIDGAWKQEVLFTFTVPIDFLLFNREMRLYESILPLIPQIVGDDIYFMSTDINVHGGNLNVFRYNLPSKTTVQISQADQEGVHHFRPLQIGNRVIFGGSMKAGEQGSVRMWISDDGDVYASFPQVPA